VPHRAESLRPATRKELAATLVLALPLHEASVKHRLGGPGDDPADQALAQWSGVLDVRTRVAGVRTADDSGSAEVPAHVLARIDDGDAEHAAG
jgi:hypothetical protein